MGVSGDDEPMPAGGVEPRHDQGRRQTGVLFDVLNDVTQPEQRRRRARDDLVHLHLALVRHCARRFVHRGESMDDLVQIGTIGLLKAVDRFDPEHGAEFSSYATPTIIGEIRRWFRDKGSAVRLPRRLQQVQAQLGVATAELTQSLGRSPTAGELAERCDLEVDDVLAALESANATAALSLDDDRHDAPRRRDPGSDDVAMARVEIRESVRPLLQALPHRQKRILLLRFYRNMTQTQIAAEVGISQMQVSRLLARTLEQLRNQLDDDPRGDR